jgi:hypothetical protein
MVPEAVDGIVNKHLSRKTHVFQLRSDRFPGGCQFPNEEGMKGLDVSSRMRYCMPRTFWWFSHMMFLSKFNCEVTYRYRYSVKVIGDW